MCKSRVRVVHVQFTYAVAQQDNLTSVAAVKAIIMGVACSRLRRCDWLTAAPDEQVSSSSAQGRFGKKVGGKWRRRKSLLCDTTFTYDVSSEPLEADLLPSLRLMSWRTQDKSTKVHV